MDEILVVTVNEDNNPVAVRFATDEDLDLARCASNDGMFLAPEGISVYLVGPEYDGSAYDLPSEAPVPERSLSDAARDNFLGLWGGLEEETK